MPADYTWKQGDSHPAALDTLQNADGTKPDLTGATVKLIVRALTAAAPLTLTGATTVTDPIAANVKYAPSAADTATPGQYMGTWQVTFPDSSQGTYPPVGYKWITVEENLSTVGGQQLLSLPDVKDYLNFPASDRQHDAKLIDMITEIRPVVERITGPIIPTIFEEWHDGGQHFIQVRRRPSTTYGTTPILDLIGVDEYRGPTKYNLQIVADPASAGLYSVHMDRLGKITRRTTGGGVTAFPAMPESVHVFYRAGQSSVPPNVAQGAKELIRINYQRGQQANRRQAQGYGDEGMVGPSLGFYVPGRVRELLAPNRRAPAIA